MNEDEEYIDEVTQIKTKVRRDDKFYRLIKRITESNAFNGGIMAIICANAFWMALETEEDIKNSWGETTFKAVDYFFLAIYTVEFFLKIYAEPKNYWKSTYNLFDFLVLTLSIVQVIMEESQGQNSEDSKLGGLRVLRALRTLRTLRTVSFIRGLQVLINALIDTIRKWVIHIILLLFLLMFLFGIMGYYFFGYTDDSDKENWGSLDRAMLTLFSYVTVDGWTDQQDILDEMGLQLGSRIYTIIFIFLGHFIFTNVFIGVIIMNISEATEQYKREQRAEREAILRHKKEYIMMRQHHDVKELMERQKKSKYSNFQDMVQEFQKSLRHDESIMMSDLCTNIVWMETYIRTLDHIDNTLYSIQQLHFEMANALARGMEMKLKKKYGT